MKLSFAILFASLSEVVKGSYLGNNKVLSERAVSNVHLHNTIPGQTMVGDTLPFFNPLLEGDNKVGMVAGICTYLDTQTLIWECQFTMSLDDGDVSIVGTINENNKCTVQVIVGGTGAYLSAEGTDTMCWPEEGNKDYTHTIELQSKPSPSLNMPMIEWADIQAQIYYSSFGQMSIGDTNPFYNKLYANDNVNQIGILNGVCTYLNIDPIIMQCYTVYEYPQQGKIASMGLLKQQEKCTPQTIAGGTGKYLGSQGTIDLCWPEETAGNYTHDLKLAEPAVKPSGEYVVIEKPTSNTHIYNTQYGVVSIGDSVPFRNELYDENDEIKIGTLNGVCTYVKLAPRAWACEMVYETATGQVMAAGTFGDENECQTMPIIGGTASFTGVDGSVEVCWPDTGVSYKHTLKFDTTTQSYSSAVQYTAHTISLAFIAFATTALFLI